MPRSQTIVDRAIADGTRPLPRMAQTRMRRFHAAWSPISGSTA